MTQQGFEEVAGRAVRISELIEEIIQLDELLALHVEYDAHKYEIQQNIDRRLEFLKELNDLIRQHHLKIILEDGLIG